MQNKAEREPFIRDKSYFRAPQLENEHQMLLPLGLVTDSYKVKVLSFKGDFVYSWNVISLSDRIQERVLI